MTAVSAQPRGSSQSEGDVGRVRLRRRLRPDQTFGEAVRAYLRRVRGGDMGSLPAVLGLIVLFVVFGLANDRFLSALNLANLVTQAGSICVLAMGLVFVLLLGDIDLSAGVAGGVSACVMALTIVNAGWPWWACDGGRHRLPAR